MADRLESKAPAETQDLEACLVRLEESVRAVRAEQGPGTAETQAFLLLSRRIERLVVSLDKEV